MLNAGDKNGFYGKSHTAETKHIIALSKLGNITNEETKNKQRDAMTGNKNSMSKNIHLISPEGIIIKCFGDFAKQCKQLNLPLSTMNRILSGKYKAKFGVCVGWAAIYV